MIKNLVGMAGALGGALIGGWLILAPFALAYQISGADWIQATYVDLWSGLALLAISLVGLISYALGLVEDVRRRAVVASGRSAQVNERARTTGTPAEAADRIKPEEVEQILLSLITAVLDDMSSRQPEDQRQEERKPRDEREADQLQQTEQQGEPTRHEVQDGQPRDPAQELPEEQTQEERPEELQVREEQQPEEEPLQESALAEELRREEQLQDDRDVYQEDPSPNDRQREELPRETWNDREWLQEDYLLQEEPVQNESQQEETPRAEVPREEKPRREGEREEGERRTKEDESFWSVATPKWRLNPERRLRR